MGFFFGEVVLGSTAVRLLPIPVEFAFKLLSAFVAFPLVVQISLVSFSAVFGLGRRKFVGPVVVGNSVLARGVARVLGCNQISRRVSHWFAGIGLHKTNCVLIICLFNVGVMVLSSWLFWLGNRLFGGFGNWFLFFFALLFVFFVSLGLLWISIAFRVGTTIRLMSA